MKARPVFLTLIAAAILLSISPETQAQFTSNHTPTYEEAIAAYGKIANTNPKTAKLTTFGETDALLPLHLLIIDAQGGFTPESAKKHRQTVCLILNGIHPGEPCGINASIAFAEEKAADPTDNTVYLIVPIYNVGGALNRNSTSRYNQNGPEEYGFRGNAKNLDLNRDFVKCNSRNALSFNRLYHKWNPHVFVDTHTSNGADYQPTMTLLSTFPEKLNPMQATFLSREMVPALFEGMAQRGQAMVPYVHLKGETPEEGIVAYTDYPRYGSGYVALFNTLSFVTEAHMLKPFDDRVAATLDFLKTMDDFVAERGAVIQTLKATADRKTAETKEFGVLWKLSDEVDSLQFAGYEAEHDTDAQGMVRLRYNRDRPYNKKVPYYHKHVAWGKAQLPSYFVVPGAWHDVVERMELNNIRMRTLTKDTLIKVISDYVTTVETLDPPYEGHYVHSNVDMAQKYQELTFHAGDLLIPTDQPGNRYLANTLIAKAPDSFFNWNFFDSILRRKEYFSAYVFEDTAEEILSRNANLRRSFSEKKKQNPDFAKDRNAQLRYILDNSSIYEQAFNRIPVYGVK